ncbi:MAG: hypothetical protein LBL08_02745 [Candidatus Nomurabacteria bacterium]|jgi:hypothetical protein|nr:hypothetical protein [Candidatus Nomurabacteria bacterium]
MDVEKFNLSGASPESHEDCVDGRILQIIQEYSLEIEGFPELDADEIKGAVCFALEGLGLDWLEIFASYGIFEGEESWE